MIGDGMAEYGGVPSRAFGVELKDHHLRGLRQCIAATTAPPIRWEASRAPECRSAVTSSSPRCVSNTARRERGGGFYRLYRFRRDWSRAAYRVPVSNGA
ncbi:hypothetical protein GCM10009837_87400 [Streptomyces durmitorensis]